MRNVPSSSSARGDFGKYYLRQIAMGEGCNCAEGLVGDVRGPSTSGVSVKMLLAVLWARLRGQSAAIKSDPAPPKHVA